MGCALREALEYVQSTAMVCYFLRHLDLGDLDGRGLSETLEGLATVEPVTREAWQALGRVVRHLIAVLEDTGDARVLLLYELRDAVMARVDQAAASGRQNGGDA